MTVNVAVPAASFTVTSLIVMFGDVVSIMVPVADVLVLLALVTAVAFKVNVSTGSAPAVLVIGVRTNILVAPAAILKVVALVQVAPSGDVCILVPPPAP